MGFKYLNDKNWQEITRDERFFCAHLYGHMQGNTQKFIKLLNDKPRVQLPYMYKSLPTLSGEWTVGYEVCFYRDYLMSQGNSVEEYNKGKPKDKQLSKKRTFDLCLFSEHRMLIIEAKAQHRFDSKQVKVFEKDITLIKEMIDQPIEVNMIALASSTYYKNHNKFGDKSIRECFDAEISWAEMYELYNDPVLLRAEQVYKN
jgi:hypothetical protein